MRSRYLLAAGAVAAFLLLGLTLTVSGGMPASPQGDATAKVPMAQLAAAPALPSAPSAPATPAAAPALPAARTAPPTQAGMVVAIDPETGQLGMPSPEQLAELGMTSPFLLNESADGLVETQHPDGSVSIDLEGRFQDYAVARLGRDGKPVFGCVHNQDELRRFVQNRGPAPAALEEK
jgi:hypothetical protein